MSPKKQLKKSILPQPESSYYIATKDTNTDVDNISTRFGIIKSFFNDDSLKSLKELEPCERLFIYYMYMASIMGYPIFANQNSKHALSVIGKICTTLKDITTTHDADFVSQKLKSQLETYWIFLFTNYGTHFQREFDNNKKTPAHEDLNLNLITPSSLEKLGVNLTDIEERYLFDPTYFPTLHIAKNIERSANNFHGDRMITPLWDTLEEDDQNKLNAYHEIDFNNDVVITRSYSTKKDGYQSEHLTKCVSWIKKAYNIASSPSNSKYFDKHTSASLAHLIKYLDTGDEIHFREHSKEWLQMNNRVEYTFGFIEQYDDPMGRIGSFQADVTVKSLNIDSLLQRLPNFEANFDFPDEWKRSDMTNIPNAAEAHKIIGIGGLGPSLMTIAYCLPNYNDIRSKCGSKQVMYSLPKPTNLPRYMKVFLSREDISFYEQYSPDMTLEKKIYSLLVTLHETIGHASGNNVAPLTNDLKAKRIGKWNNGLEEMRAEILALYTALTFYDDIVDTGILGDWTSTLTEAGLDAKVTIKKLFIEHFLQSGWTRWSSTPINSTDVTQAHALADTAILYYLIDNCPEIISLEVKNVSIDDDDLTVLRVVNKITSNNLSIVEDAVKQMATTVQRFSSTAPTDEINEFMNTYAVSTRDKRFGKIVKNMTLVSSEGAQQKLQIFPEWKLLLKPESTAELDAIPSKPDNALNACLKIWDLTQ